MVELLIISLTCVVYTGLRIVCLYYVPGVPSVAPMFMHDVVLSDRIYAVGVQIGRLTR
jgi:hypothetical protein